ncbi:CocE/NonD family hydrolase [Streptomyces sp. NPDC047081]|uniref:CocE/NonD family hydrolase n=1 Tax=Streptomyces sp. NPDC047081 TaxID=3154706 RepID=UPI003407E67A
MEFSSNDDFASKVLWRPIGKPSDSHGMFPALEPGTSVVDGIVAERDVAVALRDGTTIYVDIYRPEGAVDVPAIVAWSPYGKRAGYAGLNNVPGVPPGTYSEATKLEGPDPLYWTRHGYAVINPDSRGAGNSEGRIPVWCAQEGRDIADLIEWTAQQEWSNEKVGMAGNSWLAASQWWAAAERPPHLAAIAPWEGLTDLYRHLVSPGGIPEVGFTEFLLSMMHGTEAVEDLVAMRREYPNLNEYWESKRVPLERIEIPTYMTAGWSHFHLMGVMDAFRRISSSEKWLRAHRDFEWPDQYASENLADLRLFFDRYLKGEPNGWELTPPVRIDVMDAGDRDHEVRRVEKAFPLPDTQWRTLPLDAAGGSLVRTQPDVESKVRYDAQKGTAHFDLTVEEPLEITGYMKLRLWVEADGSDDADLFVSVQKLGLDGAERPTLVLGQPHHGAWATLRVSHRELDETASTPSEPVLIHSVEQLLSPGEVVPVEIGFWPTSRFWHAGETLRVIVSGHSIRDPRWFEPFAYDLRNAGEHIIHTGGRYDSHLLIPVIPPAPLRPVLSDAPLSASVLAE